MVARDDSLGRQWTVTAGIPEKIRAQAEMKCRDGSKSVCPFHLSHRQRFSVYERRLPHGAGERRNDPEHIPGGVLLWQQFYGWRLGYSQAQEILLQTIY